jgi:hypothetical protein
MSANCRPISKDQLTDPILVQTDGELDFAAARAIADREAEARSSQPMLLAWYEAKTGRYSPPVECCGDEKPAWLIYAESRGGRIVVDINDEDFIFVYLDADR